MAMALSPRTAETPGAWYGVEQSEQVGIKLLKFQIFKVSQELQGPR